MDEQYSAKATFAGGCFWCLEEPFAVLPGVVHVQVGYSGGSVAGPTYEQVCSGQTGHLEAIQISYNPEALSYQTLLDTFWRSIDPFDSGGQFVDRGAQYQSAIFFHNQQQRSEALASVADLANQFGRQPATQVLPFASFYPAEPHHQGYYCKQPRAYNNYKQGSGRSIRLRQLWGTPLSRPVSG